jgi:hypothetical protein
MRRNIIASLFLSFATLASAPAAEETAVVTEGKINVRGKPSLVGEVVTQLERGDKVTVLERIPVEKPKPNEPTNWARIKLPANTPVWVFAPFVKEGKVAATRLNLRAGPGENHDVIGRLNRGDEVKAIRTVAEWAEVEAPPDAYAFIDLSLIRFDGDTNAPAAPTTAAPTIAAVPQPQPQTPAPTDTQPATAVPPATPTPETNTVASTEPAPPAATPPAVTPPADPSTIDTAPVIQPAPAIQPAPTTVDTQTPAPAATAQTQPESTPAPLPKVAQPLPPRRNEPLPKRIVRREGIIRPTKSIQAPTWFELGHADTGKTVNYLYDQKFSANSGIKLKDYRGQKVVVTGEEAIDPRWPNTPILDLETLDVLP